LLSLEGGVEGRCQGELLMGLLVWTREEFAPRADLCSMICRSRPIVVCMSNEFPFSFRWFDVCRLRYCCIRVCSRLHSMIKQNQPQSSTRDCILTGSNTFIYTGE
jgi:hypothetical protein